MSHLTSRRAVRARLSRASAWVLAAWMACGAFPVRATWAQTPATDTTQARFAGLQDGRPGGEREGRERGAQDGYRRGFDRGEDEAYRDRLQSRRRDAYQFGYAAGFPIGEQRGFNEGEYRGRLDGESRGQTEGQQDGERRASQDATATATPPGRQKGAAEAAQSDAAASGRQAGIVRGDQDAQDQAQRVDYGNGRRAYRDERFAEGIEHRETFSQLPSKSDLLTQHAPAPASTIQPQGLAATASLHTSAGPDYRYLSCTRSFPTAAENQAYQSACREGYAQAFQTFYNDSFRTSEQQGQRDGRDRGRSRADKVDVRPEYLSGYTQGENEGYRRAYDRAYEQTFRIAYSYAFQQSTQRAYDQSYPSFYERAFEAARAAAYREHYEALFNEAFELARNQTYQEKYPAYAKDAFERGRRDEEREFELNPLRLIDAQISKEFASGNYEPGEALRFTVDLRNFSRAGINSQDVSFSVEAGDARTAAIPLTDTSARRGLKPLSLTRVTEVLEARLFESTVGRTVTLVIKAKYQGRVIGQKAFDLTPRFMLALGFAKAPQLREGMETVIRIKVTNQSLLATDAGARVQFLAESEALELVDRDAILPNLQPGASTEVGFRVVGKRAGDWVRIPMAFTATLASGRRVGVFDITDQVPIINDYGIDVLEGLDRMRQPGITRIEYVINNETSRLVLRSLQLHVRVRLAGPDQSVVLSEHHAVLGPNPQYLTPIHRGYSRDFFVPILIKAPSNANLILEMELKEEGKTVVIHRRTIEP